MLAIKPTVLEAAPTQKISLYLLIVFSLLMGVTSLSTDAYLPAMPVMERDLQGGVEFTITGFLIGFSIAQLVWGPISDRIGRKKPLIIGMLLFFIGSLGCAYSYSISQIMFWRIIQAIGACVGPMLTRAMVRDLFQRTAAAQVLSTLMAIMAIAPIIGPLAGGQIIQFASWHMIFICLAVIALIMLSCVFFIPETHPIHKRTTDPLHFVFNQYRQLLSNVAFMRYTLCVTFFYVGVYAFIVESPFVYIEYFGINTQYYGWFFAVNIIGVVGLSLINRQLVLHYSLDALMRFATLFAFAALVILFVIVEQHWDTLWLMVVFIFAFFSMNGIIAASATSAALDLVPNMAGTGAALIGSLQYGSGIISSLLLAYFSDNTPFFMVLIMMLFVGLSVLMVLFNKTLSHTDH